MSFAGVGVDGDTLSMDRRRGLISMNPDRGVNRGSVSEHRHGERGATIIGEEPDKPSQAGSTPARQHQDNAAIRAAVERHK